MSHFNATVLTFLRRVGSRNFSVISRISPSLYSDLAASSGWILSSHCSREMGVRRCPRPLDMYSSNTEHDLDTWIKPLYIADMLPGVLLFLTLPPPPPGTSVVSTLQRFATFTSASFAPAPRVTTVVCCLLRHVLPARYEDALTVSLVVLVAVLGVAQQQSGSYTHRWTRREGRAILERRAEQEERELAAIAKTLPSWLLASVTTPPKVDLTEVLDEIVRRLPPEGEMMPGDYLESVTRTYDAEADHMFREPLSDILRNSSKTVVRPAELMMLMPKVIECGLRYDKAYVSAQIRQNEYLMDYAPPMQRRRIYTPSARDAFARALSSLALLRYTKTVVAARPLTAGEWIFILSVGLCREPAWAATTHEALTAVTSDAEARRAEVIRESGKPESEVPLLCFTHANRNRAILALLASRLCDLRYDLPLLSEAVRYTMPLIREYCRVIASDREATLRELDRLYHIKQMCIAASAIDLVCVSEDYMAATADERGDLVQWDDGGEEEDDDGEAGQGQPQHEQPRTAARGDKESPTNGVSVMCVLMDSMERFFADAVPSSPPMPTAATDAAPATQRRGSGFGKAMLDPDDSDRELDGDLLLRIAIVEGVIIYCKRRFTALRSDAEAPAELSDMALRTLRRFRLLIVKLIANSSRINAVVTRGAAVTEGSYQGASADARDPKVVREIELRDSRALRLICTATLLLGWLQKQRGLTEAQRCDVVELLGFFISDLIGFVRIFGESRTPPPNLNRVMAHIVRVRDNHDRLIRMRPLQGERGVAAVGLVRDSAHELTRQILRLVLRVAPSVLRPGATAATDNVAVRLSNIAILGRTADRALDLGRSSGLTVVDMPDAAEAIVAIADGTRASFALLRERRSRNAERIAAEQATRSMCLFALLSLLSQACNLSITDEGCLTALAQTLEVCGDEKAIKGMPLDRRQQSLNLISSSYLVLGQRFAGSKASRDAAEQVLTIAYRMTLDRTAYQPPASWNAGVEPRVRAMMIRLHICEICIKMWQVGCCAVPTVLPNGLVEKCIAALLAYVKRNLVLPVELADMPDSEVPATMADLEYCEERLVRAPTTAAVLRTWTVATSKRTAVEQCIVLAGIITQALRRMDTLGFLESGHTGSYQRLRWVQVGEASVEILLRYQRWVAPSIWLTVWRNLRAIRVIALGNSKPNATIDTGVATAQLRMLAYIRAQQNHGQWSPRRTMRMPVWNGDDVAARQRASAAVGKDGAGPLLLDAGDVARILEAAHYMTDITLRLYAVELLDGLLAKEEERLRHRHKSAAPPVTRFLSLRLFDTMAETPEETENRRLRSTLVQIMYNCRRVRS